MSPRASPVARMNHVRDVFGNVNEMSTRGAMMISVTLDGGFTHVSDFRIACGSQPLVAAALAPPAEFCAESGGANIAATVSSAGQRKERSGVGMRGSEVGLCWNRPGEEEPAANARIRAGGPTRWKTKLKFPVVSSSFKRRVPPRHPARSYPKLATRTHHSKLSVPLSPIPSPQSPVPILPAPYLNNAPRLPPLAISPTLPCTRG